MFSHPAIANPDKDLNSPMPTPSMQSSRQRLAKWLIPLALFAGIRLLLLLSSPYAIFDDEEMFNGTAALELLRGINLPLQDYMYWPHEGGALVMSFLTAPFLKLLGPNFVAMKLSALLVSLATFAIWLRIALRTGGTRVAWCLAFLYCLAPPLILKSDLMIWGHHNNICFFIAAAMLFLLEYLRADSLPHQRRYLICLGLVCGFGMFFAYIFVVMLATVLTVLLVLRIRKQEQIFRFFLPSLAGGFLPWGLIRLSAGFPAGPSVFASRGVGLPSPAEILAKAQLLLTRDLPLSPCFRENLTSAPHIFSKLYFGLLAVSAAVGLLTLLPRIHRLWHSSRRSGESRQLQPPEEAQTLVWLYCGIFLVTFCLSPFIIELEAESLRDHFVTYRYLVPLYPALFFLVAHVLGGRAASDHHAIPPRVTRYLRLTAWVLLVILGLLSAASTIPLRDLGKSLTLRGYSYERFGWRMYGKYGYFAKDTSQAVRVGQGINPDHVEDYYRGLGWGLGQFGFDTPANAGADPFQYFLAIANQLPAEYRHFAYEGLGWLTMERTDGSLRHALANGEFIAPPYRGAFYRGIGWIIGKRFFTDPGQALKYLDAIPPVNRAEAFYGFGRVLGENQALGKYLVEPQTLAAPEWRAAIAAGAEETERRYREGRYLEGPVWVNWGGIVFREYGER